MSVLNKEEIIYHLQQQQNYIIQQGINPNRILGIFLYGSQNYNFANRKSDIDSKVIILPTFEDFCLTPQMISKEYHYGPADEEHIEVKDIRLMREMFMKQNINFVETLFTEYYILNPKYEKLFNFYFIDNREKIAHYNREQTVKSVGGQLLHTLYQDPSDSKKLYNALRLYRFLKNYIEDKPYQECLTPTGEEWIELWQLKYGESILSRSAEAKIVRAESLAQDVNKLLKECEGIQSPYHNEAAAALDQGVIAILKASFDEIECEIYSAEDFFNKLTSTEIKAYYSIINEIKTSGIVVISQLVEKNNISRPIYNNLINKMKRYKVADIESRGMKGMRIQLTQPDLIQEAAQLTGDKT